MWSLLGRIRHVILDEEVGGLGHGLELEVVARRVLAAYETKSDAGKGVCVCARARVEAIAACVGGHETRGIAHVSGPRAS